MKPGCRESEGCEALAGKPNTWLPWFPGAGLRGHSPQPRRRPGGHACQSPEGEGGAKEGGSRDKGRGWRERPEKAGRG